MARGLNRGAAVRGILSDEAPRPQVCAADERVHRSALRSLRELALHQRAKRKVTSSKPKQAAQKAVQVLFDSAYAPNCEQRAP